MTLITRPIDDLAELSNVPADAWLLVKDPATGRDYKVKKSSLLAGSTTSYAWSSGTTYAINAIVEFAGKFWRSLQNANTANVPSEGTWWTEVAAADESAIKQFQANKVYKSDLVVVLNNDVLYRLTTVTRPYQASSFVADDWKAINDLHFKGVYVSLSALNTAHSSASAGDYAFVDAGIGQDALFYIWDVDDTQWIQSGSNIATPNASETVKGVVQKATDEQFFEGQSIGSSGAFLFGTPEQIVFSGYINQV